MHQCMFYKNASTPSSKNLAVWHKIGGKSLKLAIVREAFKKKIKSLDFFHTGWGGQPQIHTFLKVWIFKGGWGVLGPISTLFCPILFF